MATYEKIVLNRFNFRGFHGCRCVCGLEILAVNDRWTVVIATEREDNPGTSITNVAENLASEVCDHFEIDPDKLVWIEHYAYACAIECTRERTLDGVTFTRRDPDSIRWSKALGRHKPDGWPGYFQEPVWRPMKEEDWKELGLSPRSPVKYEY